jgi:hypothetical protein
MWLPLICTFNGFSKKSSCDVKLLKITLSDFKKRGLSYRNQKVVLSKYFVKSLPYMRISILAVSH